MTCREIDSVLISNSTTKELAPEAAEHISHCENCGRLVWVLNEARTVSSLPAHRTKPISAAMLGNPKPVRSLAPARIFIFGFRAGSSGSGRRRLLSVRDGRLERPEYVSKGRRLWAACHLCGHAVLVPGSPDGAGKQARHSPNLVFYRRLNAPGHRHRRGIPSASRVGVCFDRT